MPFVEFAAGQGHDMPVYAPEVRFTSNLGLVAMPAAGLPSSRFWRVSALDLARLRLIRSAEQIGDPAA